MMASAPAAAARALSLGQPSRGATSRELGETEIGHGARGEADILAKLRLDQNYRRRDARGVRIVARDLGSLARRFRLCPPSRSASALAFIIEHDAIGASWPQWRTGTESETPSTIPRGDFHVNKIKVKNPVADLDGDEMTRVIWQLIKDKLILPYLDLPSFAPSIFPSRTATPTDDQVTIDAAHAIKDCGVGIKCATITPDEARVKEFGLKKMWKSPNGTIRNILGGVIFREPIICRNVPRLVPGWTKPIVIGRHAYGDVYRATDFRVPGKGKLTISFVGEDGTRIEHEVHEFKGRGVALAMFNLDNSIRDFARASLNYGLHAQLCRSISPPRTPSSRPMTGASRISSPRCIEAEFRRSSQRRGLTYEHRLIDDMVAAC